MYVTLKAEMPKGDSLYVSGNLLELGNWEPAGKKFQTLENGKLYVEFNAKKGSIIECKLSRGTWKTQAIYKKNDNPPDNIVIKADKDKEVKVTIYQWLDKRAVVSDPVQGSLLQFDRFECKGLKHKREIQVWLPVDYSENAEPYSVIYMHDGQNLFEPGNAFNGTDWKVDETITRLIAANKIKPCIVVGIPNSPDRMRELNLNTPLGKAYAKFVIDEVMPFIQTKFNVSKNHKDSFIGGSSMGGLMSFQMGFKHPDKFGGAICMSSAFQRKFTNIIDEVKRTEKMPLQCRFYMDTGEYEIEPGEIDDIVICYKEMMQLMKEKGFVEGENLMGYFDKKATHTESAWAKRFNLPLTFLLGK